MTTARAWALAAAALFAVGVLLRAALYVPLAAFPIDSDGVLAGLCAFHIGAGHYPLFFPGGTRLSAASCYVAAGFFSTFGRGRLGLALTGLSWGVLYLVFMLLFTRAALGRRTGTFAFLFAVMPAAAFVVVTYIPWGYGEIAASCAATLWLATLWRNEGRVWQRALFGISVGLGIWFSLQTLMIALPAIAWIGYARRRLAARESLIAVAGAIVGLVPFLAGNAFGGFPSFTNNWASRPAPSLEQATQNLGWLFSAPLPQLLYYGFPGWRSPSTFLIAGYLLAAVGIVLAIRRDLRDGGAAFGAREAGALLLAVAIATVVLFAGSQAGSIRGWTVRYVAPLYVPLPLLLGLGVVALWDVRKWLAVTAAALLIVPNILLYSLPGSPERAALAQQLQTDAHVVAFLQRARVAMVYGDYFDAYHLNFDSSGSVLGIPSDPSYDYMHYAKTLPRSGVRYALIGTGAGALAERAAHAGIGGHPVAVGNYEVLVAARPTASTSGTLARLRAGR